MTASNDINEQLTARKELEAGLSQLASPRVAGPDVVFFAGSIGEYVAVSVDDVRVLGLDARASAYKYWFVETAAHVVDLTAEVEVELMPEQHRESRRAAGNWGLYPCNGAIREVMSLHEALDVVSADPDGYNEIVDWRDAIK